MVVAAIVGCLFTPPVPANALDTDKSLAQCRLDIWTAKDGLPPRDIQAIAQTPDGYLWLGTQAGLVRFDGQTFKVFHSRNTPGMTRDVVTSLGVSNSGELWLGTDGGGFGRFTGEQFIRSSLKETLQRWSVIKAIHPARDGSIWFGGQGDPHFLHLEKGKLKEVMEQFQDITGIVEDQEGNLWFAVRYQGVVRLDVNHHLTFYNEKQGLPSTTITSICIDADNHVWVGTEKNGVCRFANGKLRTYTVQDGLSSNEIHSLYSDREGNLWIGTRSGICRKHQERFIAFHKIDGLFDENVGPIFEDREGNLWVGSGAGLNRFNNYRFTPLSLHSAKGISTLNSLCEGWDGSVWFATSDGVQRLHEGKSTPFGKQNGLPEGEMRSIWTAKDGTAWLLSVDGTLYHERGGHFTCVVSKLNVHTIGGDAEGLILCGYDKVYRLENGTPKLLSGDSTNYTFTVHTDSQGTFWFGCDRGLACVQKNRVRVIKGLPPEAHVLSIDEDADGTLWLGTDKGLARYHDGKYTLYTTRIGLPDDNLYQILVDRHRNVWVGGNRGIFQVKIRDLDDFDQGRRTSIPYKLYETSDGIRRFPLLGSAIKTHDGRLWFKGDTEITVIDPDHLHTNALAPAVRIEQATMDGLSVNLVGASVLPPGKGELEIRYTGLSYVVPEKVLFRYRLEGYDKEWVDAGTRRAAYYTNLPPGKYTFHVIACNNDGVWNNTGANFTMTLRPCFYQTSWFKATCILTTVFVVWGIYRVRMRQLRHLNLLLEAKVTQRTEQLRRSKEEIEAANRQLHALATTDGMTGLSNHRAFQERLRVELSHAEITGQTLTMLLVDVDHFKSFNDTYGHPAGDEVLRVVARLLRENVREGDFPARYGGEEFAVLLPNTNAATTLNIAERIRKAVAAHPFACRQITLSIGAAMHLVEKMAAETFVDLADRALYAAKHAGRNRVIFADEEIVEITLLTEPVAAEPDAPASPPLATYPEARQDTPHSLLHAPHHQTLAGMLALLNLRDPETDGHSHRVARYALRIAEEVIRMDLVRLSPDDLRDLTIGSLLHDIGKIGVPDEVLFKPGALNEAEWDIIRAHPQQGANILTSFSELVCALPVVRSHHERWDGSGYPEGLAGRAIPLAARIFALADTLDAMSSDRPYRKALTYRVIRAEVQRMAGVQFDPELVRAFLSIPETEKTG